MRRVTVAFSALRKVYLSKVLLLMIGLMTLSLSSKAEIITTLGTISTCPNQDILVPINVQNFTGVAAASLQFTYDTNVMDPILCNIGGNLTLCYQNLNPAINGIFLCNELDGVVTVGFFVISGTINIGNGLMVNLRFHTKTQNGYTPLTWSPDPNLCNYSDANFNLLPATFINGNVHTSPSISQQPVNLTVIPGANGSFSLTAVETNSYQWQVSTDGGIIFNNLVNNTVYSGVNSNTLNFTGATTGMSGYKYRCQLTGNCTSPYNTTYSNVVTLTVSIPCPTAYSITPSGAASYCPGGTGVNIGLVDSEIGVTYQLYLGTTPVGTAILGTGDAISFGPQTTLGTYSAKGTNSCGTTNMLGTCVVSLYTAPIATISTVIPNVTICAGGSANLSLILSGSKPFNVVYSDGTTTYPINNINSNTYIFPVSPTTTTTYTLVSVTDNHGCTGTVSGSALVTVNPSPTLTVGSNSPVCTGQTLNLSLITNGISYMWLGPNSFSSTQQNPSITNVTTANAGIYYVTVTGSNTCTRSGNTTVVVYPPLPEPAGPITGPNSVCKGQNNVSYTVGAITNATSYVWTVPAGFDIVSGQGTTTLVVNINNSAVTGNVSVYGNNGCGNGTASDLLVAVNNLPNAQANNNGPVCVNGTLNLTSSGGTSYAWSGPNGFTSAQQNPSIIGVTLAAGGLYTVTVTNAATCTATATTTVVVNTPPTATAGNDGPVCPGGTIHLTSGGGVSYLWSGPNGFSSTQQNPYIFNATSAMAGLYTVTVTNSLNCSATATTTQVVNSAPTAGASNTGPVCEGASLTLNATGGGTYLWSGPAGFSSNLQNPQIPVTTLAMGGAYTVTVTGTNSCTAIANTLVTINPKPTAFANNNSPVCAGGTVNLNSGTGASYAWTGPNGFTSALQNPVISNAQLINGGTYTVVVTGSNTCTNSANTTVTVNANPVANAGSDQNIFIGTAATLSGSATGGSGNYQYFWQPSSLVVNPAQAVTLTVPLSTSTTFTLQVTDANTLCTGTDDVLVNVLQNPIIVNIGVTPGNTICAGNSVQLTANATGGNGTYTYTWSSVPAGFTSSIMNPTVTPAVTTTYSVTVSDGITSGNASVVITVNPLPVVDAGPDQVILAGNTATLNGSATGGSGNYSFHWEPAALVVNPNVASTVTVPMATTTPFTLLVTDLTSGCQSSDAVLITVQPNPIVVNINTSPGNTICIGTGVQMAAVATGGNGNYQYTWSSDPAGFTSGIFNPFVLPSVTTTYFVTVSDGFTSGNASVTITVNPLPVVYAGPDQTIFYYTTAQLDAVVSSGTGPFTYSWTPAPLLVNPLIANPVTVPLTSQTLFTVTVVDQGTGCTNTDQVVVFVQGLPLSVTANVEDNEVCAGNQVQLHAVASGGSGTYTYTWASDPAGFASSIADPTDNPVVTTTYYVTVSDGFNTIADDVTVTVNAYPTSFNLSGGGDYCAGAIALVTMDGSETGMTYQLYASAGGQPTVPVSGLINGTGSAMEFEVTATNEIMVIASNGNTGCNTVMNGIVAVNFHPYPLIFDGYTQAPICNENGIVPLWLNGSEAGVDYQLYKDGNPTGDVLSGNGSAILLGNIAESGLYTCQAVNAFGCQTWMNVNLQISVYNTPSAFTVGGGGFVCADQALPAVTLDGSEAGIDYTLYHNSLPTGVVLTGTGDPLTFTFAQAGTFTVVAANPLNNCTTNMPGSAETGFYPTPVADAGPNQIIPYGTSTTLNGSGSNGTNFGYAWQPAGMLDDPNIQNPQTVVLTENQTYTLVVTDINTLCASQPDQVTISIPGFPLTLTPSAQPGEFCIGGNVNLGVAVEGGSGTYNYSWTSDPAGFTSSLANPVATPVVTTIYYVEVTDGFYTETANVTVIVNPMPTVFDVTGGGGNCPGVEPTNPIELTGSETGFNYELYLNGNPTGIILAGNGASLSFTDPLTQAGFYTIYASNPTTNCNGWMNGEVEVYFIDTPIITFQPTDVTIQANDNASFTVVSDFVTSYQWEMSADGNIWSPLTDDAVYSGTQTATLTITAATIDMNNTYYRCLLENTLCDAGKASVYTEAALLIVNPEILEIVTSLPTLNLCPGAIIVPLHVNGMEDVAALSLSFTFETANMTYTGFQNINPAVNDPYLFSVNEYQGVVYLSHFTLTPYSILDGDLIELLFNYTGGNAALNWDYTNPVNNEYSDINGDDLAASYVDGSITSTATAPVIVSDPADASVEQGTNATFGVTANGATQYQWEVYAAGIWTPLSDDAIYSGVNTSLLTITGATLDMDGNLYHCVVSEDVCNLSVTSADATLDVYYVPEEIVTTIGSATSCPDNTIILPVTVTNLVNIAAISLTLDYDQSVLTYTGYQNLNPVFNESDIIINSDPGTWGLSWFNLIPVDLAGGTLMELVFTYQGGNTGLNWDLATTGNCEYDDYNGTVMPASFNNGTVSQLAAAPVIVTQPADASVIAGDNATFQVTATGADTYQWLEFNGSSWNVLADDAIYSGTNTPELTITGTNFGMDGNLYHCVITESICNLSVITEDAVLNVGFIPVTINTVAGNAIACPGTEVVVPVTADNMYNIAAISLTLNYNASVLNYTGYQNLNPIFNPSEVIINSIPGTWGFSWFSLTPVELVSGTLLDLTFDFNGGYSDLIWDVTTPGFCEYDDYDGNIAPASFVNGSVDSYPAPAIYTQPADASIFDMGTASFAVGATNATGFAWSYSSDGGLNWYTLADDAMYSGTQTSTLTLVDVPFAMNGYQYRCAVSNENCEILSEAAVLNVLPIMQDIVTTAPDVQACPGSTIVVPVNAQYIYNVAAISLVLNYDPSVINYTGYQNLNSNLNPAEVSIYNIPGSWGFSWFSLTPLNFMGGDLVELVFDYLGGSTDLTWDLATSGNCEYDDFNANILPAIYINGSVGPDGALPEITQQPSDLTVFDLADGTFSVNATNGMAYLWQVSTDGGFTWYDLADGGVYSGTATSTLSLTNTPIIYDQNLYRCIVTGDVCSVASEAGLLTVLPLNEPIEAILPNVLECPDNQVVVPILVQNVYNIAAVSLTFNYDPAVMTYVNYQNLNPQLAGGISNFYSVPGEWKFSWFSLTPVNIGTGILIEPVFNYLGGASDLTWDLAISGNCEFADFNANSYAANYTNGSIGTPGQIPEVVTAPADMTVTHGDNAQFSLVANGAAGYQWQVSTDGGVTWTNLAENVHYSGVNTPDLFITDALYLYNGYQYRCLMTGDPCLVPSPAATLTVNPVPFTINTYAATLTACPGNDIIVPITVTDLYNVASVSLVMNYNDAVLTYLGYDNLNPAMSNALISPTPGQFIFAWYSIFPASLGDATLVDLLFTYQGGSADLVWDVVTPNLCEYTDIDANTMAAAFFNGNVSSAQQYPTILTNPVATGGFVGDFAQFTVDAVNATGYQWQYSDDGGTTWFDIPDDGNVSGSNTNTMSIDSLVLHWNNSLIRVIVYGTCGWDLNSESALLTVISQPTIVTTAGNVEICGTELSVPVSAEEFNNVASFNLILNYDNSLLTFNGLQNVNAALGTVNVLDAAGVLTMSWTGAPVYLGNDQLFEMMFTSLPGITELNWDLSSIYTNSYGYDVPATFNNGTTIAHAIPVVTLDPAGPFCIDAPAAILNGLPEGGEYTGNSVDGNMFYPSVAGAGTWTVTYTFVDEYGCTNFATQDIVVNPLPEVSFEPLSPVCIDAPAVILAGWPEGGVFTGEGVDGNLFYPSVAEAGTWTLTYTYTDENGCTNFATQDITVNPLPVVTLDPVGPFCVDAPAASLTGLPEGGAFTGNGVDGNQFNPAVAGVGVWTITYTYTDENACTNSATQDIVVNALPEVSFDAVAPLCVDAVAVTLVGWPEGGTFTGIGVDGNLFDPAVAGVGTWTLTYTYTDENGCTNFATQDVVVNALPSFVTEASDTEICLGETVTFISTYTGTGPWTVEFITNGVVGTFTDTENPSEYTTELEETTTYEFLSVTDANGCTSPLSQTITIIVDPITSITTSPSSITVDESGSASFTVVAENPTAYQWLLSEDGGATWTDLVDNTVYSGATAATLNINVVTYYMNGNMYQCVVSGICPPFVTSEVATLTVNPIIITIAGEVEQCAGEVILPISVIHLHDMAAMSLSLNYDDNLFNYLGYQNANPVLNDGVLVVDSYNSQIKIGYFSLFPATIEDGLLLEVILQSEGGNTDLIWDSIVEGNCEYFNMDAEPIISHYVNGSLIVHPIPTSIGVAEPAAVCLGASSMITFEFTGTGPWNVEYTTQVGTEAPQDFTEVVYDSPHTFTYTPTATTTWTNVSITDFYGCTSYDPAPLTLTVYDQPAYTMTLSDNEFCYGNSTEFSASFTAGLAPFTLVFDHDGVIETYVTSDYTWNMTLQPESSTTYTLVSVTDGNGCTINPGEVFTIVVNPLPVVTLDPVAPVCIDGEAITLNGQPAGGNYSGNGVVDGVFYPAVAGVGTWTITYGYTDLNGCYSETTQDVVVNPLPEVTLDVLAPVCLNVAEVALNGWPEGGVYSGTGVVGNIFYPSLAGVGTWTITYTYTDGNGCTSYATQDITVIDVPTYTYTLDATEVCIGQPVTFTNYFTGVAPWTVTFLYNGVASSFTTSDNPEFYTEYLTETTVFEPLTVTDANGCVSILNQPTTIVVNPLPELSFDPIQDVCLNAVPVALIATPAGGTFSGPGVDGEFFNPALAGVGTFTLTYDYTDENSCSNTTTQTVTVLDLPTLNYTVTPTELCYGESVTWVNYFTGVAPWTVVYSHNGVISSFTTSDNPYIETEPMYESVLNEVLSVTDGTGCYVPLSMIDVITVHPLPEVTIDPVAPLCLNADTYALVGNPAGGTFTGPGIFDNMFYPALAGVGTWTVTYTFVDEFGCTNSTTADITVLDIPTLTYTVTPTTVCLGEPITWTNFFTGVGPWTVNYILDGVPATFTVSDNPYIHVEIPVASFVNETVSVTDATGCTSPVNQIDVVTVNPLPELSIDPIAPVCLNAGPVPLVGNPAGGTFSGTGVDNNVFYPDLAGVGTFTLTYVYTDGNTCTNSTSIEVTVLDVPTYNYVVSPTEMCFGEPINWVETFTGAAPWTVNYQSNGVPGSFTVNESPSYYTQVLSQTTLYEPLSVTDGNGCTILVNNPTTFVVHPLPVINIDPVAPVCIDAAPVMLFATPVGGAFTGAGVDGMMFNPALAGVGTWTITYTFTDEFGCTNSATIDVVVNPLPVVTLDPVAPVCVDAPAVDLNGLPSGGVYSGIGVAGGQFLPGLAGVGVWTITYTYVDGNGCVNFATTDITVNELPMVTLNLLDPVCVDANPVILAGGLPLGGQYTGIGVTGGVFYPAVAGVGTWTITYTYTDGNGCTSFATQDIVVNALPVVTLDPLAPVCIDAPAVVLNGLPSGGMYTGAGVSGGMFYPNVAGAGTFTLTYIYTDGNGCTNFATQDITVNPLPVVTLDPLSPVCIDFGPVALNGSPAGGVYSGAGVSGNVFTPFAVGTFPITYTYTDGNGCTNFATQNITVNKLPDLFNVVGGGQYCAGGAGQMVGLSGSEAGVVYHLFLDNNMTGQTVTGTGSVVSFGYQTEAGVYTVYAVNPATGCENWMTGSVSVIINPAPSIVTAGGLQIICQGSSALLNASVTGGTTPYSYLWTPATGLNDAHILQPTASPLSSTFYTLLVTDANGCTDTDNAFVVVNATPTVNAGLDKTIYVGTSTPMTASVGGGTAPYTYLWTPATGLSNPNILNPIASPLVTTTYTLVVTDQNGCMGTDQVVIVVDPGTAGYDVTGTVNYFNDILTPLSNTNVTLTQGATLVGTAITNTFGEYLIPTVPNGTYTSNGSSTKPWGGGNAIDALLMARHFQNLQPLSGLKLTAGDLDNNGVVNANDALLVMMRSVHIIENFTAVGDWIFETKTVTVNNGIAINNFLGLCYGDVNGSYHPTAKLGPNVSLDIRGVKAIGAFDQFELPIQAGTHMNLGAASLVLDIPAGLEVMKVTPANDQVSNLVYNIVDGKLYIEWYTTQNTNLTTGATIFNLTLRTDQSSYDDVFMFNIDGESMMGDADARILDNALITIPKVKISQAGFVLGDNYPNPFSQSTEIPYTLPEAGKVNITVYNAVGETVATIVNAEQAAGNYMVTFDGNNLPQGVYMYRVVVTGEHRNFEATRRMVISR